MLLPVPPSLYGVLQAIKPLPMITGAMGRFDRESQEALADFELTRGLQGLPRMVTLPFDAAGRCALLSSATWRAHIRGIG